MYAKESPGGFGGKPEKPVRLMLGLQPNFETWIDYQYDLQHMILYTVMTAMLAAPTLAVNFTTAFIPR